MTNVCLLLLIDYESHMYMLFIHTSMKCGNLHEICCLNILVHSIVCEEEEGETRKKFLQSIMITFIIITIVKFFHFSLSVNIA